MSYENGERCEFKAIYSHDLIHISIDEYSYFPEWAKGNEKDCIKYDENNYTEMFIWKGKQLTRRRIYHYYIPVYSLYYNNKLIDEYVEIGGKKIDELRLNKGECVNLKGVYDKGNRQYAIYEEYLEEYNSTKKRYGFYFNENGNQVYHISRVIRPTQIKKCNE